MKRFLILFLLLMTDATSVKAAFEEGASADVPLVSIGRSMPTDFDISVDEERISYREGGVECASLQLPGVSRAELEARATAFRDAYHVLFSKKAQRWARYGTVGKVLQLPACEFTSRVNAIFPYMNLLCPKCEGETRNLTVRREVIVKYTAEELSTRLNAIAEVINSYDLPEPNDKEKGRVTRAFVFSALNVSATEIIARAEGLPFIPKFLERVVDPSEVGRIHESIIPGIFSPTTVVTDIAAKFEELLKHPKILSSVVWTFAAMAAVLSCPLEDFGGRLDAIDGLPGFLYPKRLIFLLKSPSSVINSHTDAILQHANTSLGL